MPTRKLLWVWSNVKKSYAIYHCEDKIIAEELTIANTILWFRFDVILRRYEFPDTMVDLDNPNLQAIADLVIAAEKEFKKMD